MERISIFGNRGRLRRNYDPEKDYEDLLDGEPPESILSVEPPKINVFGRGGSLKRSYCAADFEIMFGYPQDNRFTENGSQNGKGDE